MTSQVKMVAAERKNWRNGGEKSENLRKGQEENRKSERKLKREKILLDETKTERK